MTLLAEGRREDAGRTDYAGGRCAGTPWSTDAQGGVMAEAQMREGADEVTLLAGAEASLEVPEGA